MKTINRIIFFLTAMAVLVACGEKIEAGGGFGVKMDGLILTFNKSVIKADNNDIVTFKAYYDGKDVTGDVTFYKVEGKTYDLVPGTFSTDQVGEYTFQAAYKTTYSDVATISAISKDIPEAAKDVKPSSTSFVRRVFFNQHTGAQCPNCPFMTYLLKKTLTGDVKDKVVLASLRNYAGEVGFANVPNPANAWPYLHIDYKTTFPYNGKVEELQKNIKEWTSEPAKVGISANPIYYEDGQIVVKVAVKAAETNEYNVGLWLMQDNFKKTQTVDNSRLSLLEGTWGDSYHYHNNCVRVAESRYLGSHVGYSLGKIEAGDTAEWIFVVNVNLGSEAYSYTDSWWEGKKDGINLDDLHFAAFVTTHEGARYNVVNVIDFKYNESKGFEYLN